MQKYIQEEKNYDKLVKQYCIGEDVSWDAIIKVIMHSAIISVYKKCRIEGIRFQNSEKAIDNVYIENVLEYCFKHHNSTSTSAKLTIRKFLESIPYEKLKEGQIVVLSSPGFKKHNIPCHMREEIKSHHFLNDCSRARDEDFINYFKMIESIDYKCDGCIVCDGDDEFIEKSLDRFLTKDCEE